MKTLKRRHCGSIFHPLEDGGWIAGSKAFPADLIADRVRGVRAAVESRDGRAAAQVEVLLELKGRQKAQSIPLNVGAGWADTQAAVDWETLRGP
ncbi:MAG: hypothetical protein IPN23_11300 [Elusimicrobia bacterium]|nr:hypothetical protein [Elusimicrobiota bacterium]